MSSRNTLASNIVLMLMLVFVLTSSGVTRTKQVTSDNGFGDYTVENAGVGRDGTYVLKVTTHSRKPDTELEITAKNAVHAVLFNGVPAGSGYSAIAPLVGSEDADAHKDFFSAFFKEDYRQYVNSVAKNSIEIVKQRDRTYKTSAVISINKDDLRRHLEGNGLISKMYK